MMLARGGRTRVGDRTRRIGGREQALACRSLGQGACMFTAPGRGALGQWTDRQLLDSSECARHRHQQVGGRAVQLPKHGGLSKWDRVCPGHENGRASDVRLDGAHQSARWPTRSDERWGPCGLRASRCALGRNQKSAGKSLDAAGGSGGDCALGGGVGRKLGEPAERAVVVRASRGMVVSAAHDRGGQQQQYCRRPKPPDGTTKPNRGDHVREFLRDDSVSDHCGWSQVRNCASST